MDPDDDFLDLGCSLNLSQIAKQVETEKLFGVTRIPIIKKHLVKKSTVVMKTLEEVTGAEFYSWLKTVIPYSDETYQNILKTKSAETHFDSLRVREAAFEDTVFLHKTKWLFRGGVNQKQKVEDNN